ncbi:peptide chain release factor 2 [Alkalithermobacter thermoalcaliphilus JW-YL-7 = DSM 7308]|uniref:Peptide chain release factor 2 n=1 Tax=Alkalithermobacter thermoalcaliphilus JW-YL-7 = DSM 7308 TaxID=1121328 RepID=A0A150FPX0_CLOPD|nr:Peptide chain release factor 2 [[Clostridium] paradoxum JW-YL-7 = DSM 7308]SHL06305.1 peptide chain release factor 2 [[Clostridium] paradoxum JW-YL-7 = DSM 7308]
MFLFDIEGIKEDIKSFEVEMSEPNFWEDSQRAQLILQKDKILKETLQEFEDIQKSLEDIQIMIELCQEENDITLEKDIEKSIENLISRLDEMKTKTLLSGEYDKNNAILSIHAGSGGLDAQDWAKMLLRMYDRWAEKKGYKFSMLDLQADPEAGIKSATVLVEGINAYGYLKGEKGVHRIVRISPFDSSGKRHTSFASVDVIPELDDDISIDINPNDLKIDTYRASGAGGQHVNKTESAIRITHIPTGIVVQCQNQRSQHANKETAMKMLMAKLIELKQLENKEKIEDLQGEYTQITWGSQIRSYVFHPYTLVKDHRTNAEIGNIQSVMDGNIDLFINEYLKHMSK